MRVTRRRLLRLAALSLPLSALLPLWAALAQPAANPPTPSPSRGPCFGPPPCPASDSLGLGLDPPTRALFARLTGPEPSIKVLTIYQDSGDKQVPQVPLPHAYVSWSFTWAGLTYGDWRTLSADLREQAVPIGRALAQAHWKRVSGWQPSPRVPYLERVEIPSLKIWSALELGTPEGGRALIALDGYDSLGRLVTQGRITKPGWSEVALA